MNKLKKEERKARKDELVLVGGEGGVTYVRGKLRLVH